MGLDAPCEQYSATLEVKTCPEFWPPARVLRPAVQGPGQDHGQGLGWGWVQTWREIQCPGSLQFQLP